MSDWLLKLLMLNYLCDGYIKHISESEDFIQ